MDGYFAQEPSSRVSSQEELAHLLALAIVRHHRRQKNKAFEPQKDWTSCDVRACISSPKTANEEENRDNAQ
ncbi:hypothetical protein GCM10023116_01590 [Kistimonas scapharcae]|uniref:Uncharacterized protein n=1 Tax=Kistimonas scapharcae TaxID=1036133 RepID=A0ABP8UZD5_9GAMM